MNWRINILSKKVIREIDGCKITLTFKEHNPDIKKNIHWLLLENYQSCCPVFDNSEQEAEGGKKRAS